MVVRFDALPEYRPDYWMCSFIIILYKSFHISNGMGIRKGGSWGSGDRDKGCQGSGVPGIVLIFSLCICIHRRKEAKLLASH